MKKILIGIGGLLVLAVLGVVFKFFVLSPVARAAPDVHAPTSAEAIARGKYLANSVTGCTSCHSPPDPNAPGGAFIEEQIGAGREFADEGFPGTPRARNLTPDKETGIGAYTDGELLRSMREGIGRDGHALFPLMPYLNYAALTDEDALSIIAYLRTLKPIRNDTGRSQIDFPVSMIIRTVPKPVETPAAPEPTEPVARGQWLIKMGSCADCHDVFDNHRQPIEGKHFGGGAEFKFPKGTVYAANISSDKETGIGAYTDEELLRVLNEGIAKDGRPLWVMPSAAFKGLTEDDKKAMIAALRTVPPVKNQVPRSQMR